MFTLAGPRAGNILKEIGGVRPAGGAGVGFGVGASPARRLAGTPPPLTSPPPVPGLPINLSRSSPLLTPAPQDAVTVVGEPYGTHQLLGFKAGGAPVIVVASSGLALPGYTLIVDEAAAGDIYAILVNKVR
jgi:hypothetical protein